MVSDENTSGDVKVLRIHLTLEDLARLRVLHSAGYIAESLFAMEMLRNPADSMFASWREAVWSDLATKSPETAQLVRAARSVKDPLWILSRPGDESAADGAQRREFRAVVERFAHVAMTPYQQRINAYLGAEHEALTRVFATRGVDVLLSTLHPQISWNRPVLEVLGEACGDVELNGRGLLLTPSLFLASKRPVLLNAAADSGPPTLVFSANQGIAPTRALWEGDKPGSQDLGPLVGRTRAAVLRELCVSRTTGKLAEQLGISPAGASQHAGALRDAGLITSKRHRNTVLHKVTPLGAWLLCGRTSAARTGVVPSCKTSELV